MIAVPQARFQLLRGNYVGNIGVLFLRAREIVGVLRRVEFGVYHAADSERHFICADRNVYRLADDCSRRSRLEFRVRDIRAQTRDCEMVVDNFGYHHFAGCFGNVAGNNHEPRLVELGASDFA